MERELNKFCLLFVFLVGIIFLLGSVSAVTKLIDYGFEDWTGDADTTQGYVFSTSYQEYWNDHETGTEVIQECNGRTAYEGDYYWHREFYDGAYDDCLSSTPASENSHNVLGFNGPIPANPKDNTVFSSDITSDTEFIRFYFRLTGNWPADDAKWPGIKFIRGHGQGTGDPSSLFVMLSHEGNIGITDYGNLEHHFSDVNVADGQWHSINVMFKRIDDNNNNPNMNVTYWVDDWNMANTPTDSRLIYVPELGDGFGVTTIMVNVNDENQDGINEPMGFDMDKLEVWDGMPSDMICEASQGSSCYYIDPVNGNDTTGNGSFASPWKSFANLISYYTGSYEPPGVVELEPGDHIYLMEGVHDTIVTPGDGSGPEGGDKAIAYFRFEDSPSSNKVHIKAYPGQEAILDPNGEGKGIYILQSSGFVLENLKVRDAYRSGIRLSGYDFVLRNSEIYDTDGVDNANIAGFRGSGAKNVLIENCTFHDNYDRTNEDTNGVKTGNSANMVFFRGGNITIRDCYFYQSPPIDANKTGGCLKYKHSTDQPDNYFHVYNNTFRNCSMYSIGTGTANSHIHHNLIINSGPIVSKDFGGLTHQTNQLFEYNTLYDSEGFSLSPTTNWRNEDFPNDPENITFRNNIIYDLSQEYNQDQNILQIGTYDSDTLHDITTEEIDFDHNCYYNPSRNFTNCYFCSDNPAYNGENTGGIYNLDGWKVQYSQDLHSFEENPLFFDIENENFYLKNDSPCSFAGVYGNLVQETNPCVHDADIPPCDGVVSFIEIQDYLDRWLNGEITINQLLNGINEWRGLN